MKNLKKQREKDDMNKEDVSKFTVDHCHDWNLSEVRIKKCLNLAIIQYQNDLSCPFITFS